MTTSPAATAPDPVKQERLLKMEKIRLVFFSVRHVVGVAVLLTIALQAWSLGVTSFALIMGPLGVVYAGFALVSGKKLYQQYRRRSATVARLKQQAG